MKIIVGLIVIAIGVFMVIKTEWLVSNFGTSSWAEHYMGTSGGTRLMYKLLGIVFIFGAMLYMTGMLGNLVLGILGPLFGL